MSLFGRLFDSPLHVLILVLVIVVVFGWKRLPDAARSLGRSMRIFKSEVEEMKGDGKGSRSAASSDTVDGDVVADPPPAQPRPTGSQASETPDGTGTTGTTGSSEESGSGRRGASGAPSSSQSGQTGQQRPSA